VLYFKKDSRIFLAGHRGMVGSAIERKLKLAGYKYIVTRERNELDLLSQSEVKHFFQESQVDCVILAAAKVGGIHANNQFPAEFIYENLMIECNVIHEAYSSGIRSLLFLGSSCIYPAFAQQPINESELLTGRLEPTNEPYALAKIAGIKLCESYNRQYNCDYRSLMPTNLYGPGDNFNLQNSHVIPGLLRKFHEAKSNKLDHVMVWGSGLPRREFLHVDDLAEACLFILEMSRKQVEESVLPMSSHINVGTGKDCMISELVELIKSIVQYDGKVIYDSSKPDGTPRKLLDVQKIQDLGWQSKISLSSGLQSTYEWFISSTDTKRS